MVTTQSKPQLREIVDDGKDGLGLKLNLNPAQIQVMNSWKRFIFWFCGTQGGKTSLAPHWLCREIERTARPNEINDYIVMTSTYPLLNLKLLPEFLAVFQDILKVGYYNKGERVFYFEMNSIKGRIIFASAENPESVESATAKAAVLDEVGQMQFKKTAWEAIIRRLSLAAGPHTGRILGITTLYGLGWLKTEIYDKWKNHDPDIEVIQSDSTVNPAFSKEEFERARDSMPTWKFKMFYQGQFDTPVGLIYDAFQSETNLIKRFHIPEDWPRYYGMDFGNDTAALFVTLDQKTGDWFAYREYLAAGRSTEQNVEALKELTDGETFRKRVGGAPGDDGWRGDYTKAGWRVTQPKTKHVEVGIDRTYAFFKTNKFYVFSDLYEFLNELQSYSYKLDEDNHPTGDIANKQRYHLMDSLRYVMAEFEPKMAETSKLIVVRH